MGPGATLRSWKTKAALQQVFSHVPGGARANLVFQRRVTRGLPISDTVLDETVELGRHHVAGYDRHGGRPLDQATFFEFGAGWDFAMPLVLSRLGVGSQVVVDIRRLGRSDLATDIDTRLDALLGPPSERPADGAEDDLDALLARRRVRYLAPADARDTPLADATIDCVTSTNTLEHIPPGDIAAIYAECRRILRPGGLLSFQIDYRDHYSYFDEAVSPYGYLSFDERRWRRYNPSLHFQNRLRHADHMDLLTDAGLEVLEVAVDEPSAADLDALRGADLAPPWCDRPVAEVAIQGSRVVLRSP